MSPEEVETAALRAAYKDLFNSPVGARVLKDLHRFCRTYKTTFVVDDPHGRSSASLEGRRQVATYIEVMRAESDELLREFQKP